MKHYFSPVSIGVTAAAFTVAALVSTANDGLEQQVQQAAKHNFTAASLVTNIQIEGERMRRYEKEMFIYAAVADKRAKYVKEFDEAYTKLLDQLNAAQASQHKGFTDADREKIKAWNSATSFYANEFRKVTGIAESAAPEQHAGLTTRLNAEIGPGKDRFRTLLDGAAAMRGEKLASSLALGDEIGAGKRRIDYTMFGGALLVGALAFLFAGRRPRSAPAANGGAARASAFVPQR